MGEAAFNCLRRALVFCTSFLFSAILLSPGSDIAHADDTVAERFRTEAPQHWKKLFDAVRSGVELRWTVRYGAAEDSQSGVNTELRGGEVGHIGRVRGFNEMVQTINRFGGRKGRERLEVVNEDYSFILNRSSATSAWLLSNVDQNVESVKQHGVMVPLTPVFAGLMVEGAWLDDLVASPEFEIVSAEIENTGSNGEECKVIFKSDYVIDPHNTILGGTLWLAPAEGWLLKRYEVQEQSASAGTVAMEMEFQRWKGVSLPKRYSTTFRFDKDTRYIYDFEPVSAYAGSADEFRLSAFGLPEPPIGASVQGISFWVWINVLAVVLLIVAVFLRKRSTTGAT
jgi:hypothetical protein